MNSPLPEDLVTRLRNYGNAAPGTLADAKPFSMALEAAAEIERLQAAVDEARELLNRADRMLTERVSDLLPTSKVAS